MDIGNIDLKESATVYLKHPGTGDKLLDDNKTPMTVTVYGAHSNEFRRLMLEVKRNHAAKERDEDSFDESYEEAAEFLADLTIDWNIQLDGENPEPKRETVIDLYKTRKWVRQQVEGFLYDQRNFLHEESTS